MPRMLRCLKEQGGRRQIAQIVKRGLAALIILLITTLLALIFRVGKDVWPAWVITHRTQSIGILSFALVCLILLAPILVEATSNTRTLSGPGKNPKGPRLE